MDRNPSVRSSTTLEAPFLVPVWREHSGAEPPATAPDGERWLLLLPEGDLGQAVVDRCAQTGARLSIAVAGRRFHPDDPASVARLIEEEFASGAPDAVLCAWALGEEPGERGEGAAAQRVFARLHALGVALAGPGGEGPAGPVRLVVATDRAHRAVPGDTARPFQAVADGPALVFGLEADRLTVRRADIDTTERDEATAAALAAEMTTVGEGAVAWRSGRRLALEYLPFTHSEPAGSPFARGGTYVITGGFGAIGLALARHIDEVPDTTTVLIGRNLPRACAGDDGVAGELARLRAAGARVLEFACDVADRDGLAEVIGKVRTETGRIDGVLHLAGVVDDMRLRSLSPELAARVLAPKTAGTSALVELCPDAAFLALFSSVQNLSGAYGHSAYIAANRFLDSCAAAADTDTRQVVAINWTLWGEVFGMAAPPAGTGGAPDAVRGWLATAEGIAALERILVHRPGPQVAVCPDGYGAQLSRARSRAAAAREREAGSGSPRVVAQN
ncbi:SDR family NAD(P)-dependent oxidoreductase [Streptomyces sp. NBC_00385]|uniref:SDR family NAD(P)-dependent oxidoreductase n=1 Tax=Streptomyces sp. NBC_00385 TaxID=2975733 RepID=UPI002DD83F83|nr:SDR family NAD(P)-dependent oxidoreductase [Streptomyces sp. NBC_00385]WRZ04080.1 SDR family oxidoreductase [Streptomyces sp. NBC_00385]